MTSFLLAIDGGSQSTKVSLLDPAGRVHASARVPLRPYDLTPGGRAVHPDDDLWTSLVAATRRLLEGWTGDPRSLVAVGLCGIRFCRALVDADGRLVEPVQSWMDRRVARPLGEVAPEVALVTSAGGYLTVRLTGERRDSAASFQGRWPIDQSTRRWSDDEAVLADAGVPRRLLPDLVDPGDLLGRITPDAAAATGLPAGLPVHATANDKAVEALGCGVVDTASTVLSLGTYVAAMTLGDRAVSTDDRYWTNAAAMPGRFLHESRGVRRGMWTVTWLRHLVTAAAPDAVGEEQVEQWLEDGAREVPPGSAGLVTVPDWLPPDDARHRRGAIVGLEAVHGAHHLHRSILEGLAHTMRGHLGAMEEALGRRADRLVVSGGGARSPLMLGVLADVLDREVEQAATPDAAAVGAAICASVGAGVHPDFTTAVAAMTRRGPLTTPDAARVARYRVLGERFDAVAAGIDDTLRDLPDGEPSGAS